MLYRTVPDRNTRRAFIATSAEYMICIAIGVTFLNRDTAFCRGAVRRLVYIPSIYYSHCHCIPCIQQVDCILRGHLGLPETVSEPLIVPLNYLVILHLIHLKAYTLGFLLVCSTRSSTYCSGRSSFCCDELTDDHLPADQQLHKRPIVK